MTRFIRKGYLKIKCKECHKHHSYEGRDLVFDKFASKQKPEGTETTHICSFEFFCSCDTKLKVEITLIEFPEKKIHSLDYNLKNADLLEKCNISVSPI